MLSCALCAPPPRPQTLQEWTREQIRGSYERVRRQDDEKRLQQAEGHKLSAAEQLGRWKACASEERLAAGLEKLRTALGCATIDAAVGKVEAIATALGDVHRTQLGQVQIPPDEPQCAPKEVE